MNKPSKYPDKPTLTDSYGNQMSDAAWERHRKRLIELNIKYGPIIRKEKEEAKQRLEMKELDKCQRADIKEAVGKRSGELAKEGYSHANFQSIYSSLNWHFNVPSYHEIKSADAQKAMKFVAGWYPKKAEDENSNP